MLDSRVLAPLEKKPMSTPDTITPAHEGDELDLLDLLVVLAENLKLLILLPLLAGIAALGISYLIPKTFESNSILQPNKPGVAVPGQLLASYIKSTDVLERVANEVQFKPDLSPERRLKALEKHVLVNVGKQDQLVTLKTHAHSPDAARQLNQVIWQQVLPLTVPRPKEMERLQEQLKSEQERLQSGEKLEASTAQLLGSGATNESTARLYGELLTSNSARQRSIATLESQMEGLTAENLAQQPTLPEAAIKPQKPLIAIGASLATGFLVLLFVFGRHALRGASQDPTQADKVQRLRRALRLKS